MPFVTASDEFAFGTAAPRARHKPTPTFHVCTVDAGTRRIPLGPETLLGIVVAARAADQKMGIHRGTHKAGRPSP